MLSESGIEKARQELLKIIPVVEWGHAENKIFPECAQNIFCMYGESGFGWYLITTDTHPTLNIEFLGASFESAIVAAKIIADPEKYE